MTVMQRLLAKQKADAARVAEQAAKRRAARIARKVSRTAVEPSDLGDGLNDLPLSVAVAIEENPAQPVKPEPAPVSDDSVANLRLRLEAIRERIWRLQSVFAVSLSQETAIEANHFLQLFQALAEQLKQKDPTTFDSLVRGHESLLLSPPIPLKQSIPISTQRLVEMRWQAMTQPTQRAPHRPTDTIHDGLSWML